MPVQLVDDAERGDDAVDGAVLGGEDLDATTAMVDDATVALHADEARHLGLSLALGRLDVRVDGLVEPGRS